MISWVGKGQQGQIHSTKMGAGGKALELAGLDQQEQTNIFPATSLYIVME